MQPRPVLTAVLLSTIVAAAPPAVADAQFDTIAVCAPQLMPAAQQWMDYRTKQGHQIKLVSGGIPARAIQQTIRKLASESQLRFVVLIGDAPATTVNTKTQVDTFRIESNVIKRWGAEPSFASDHFYSDVDDDGKPDVAVGRITADSAAELSSMIEKIIRYEQTLNVGMWRRRINFIAGVGGFGMVADKLVETAAKKLITSGIPAAYKTTMTQASWRSAYSPDPRHFQAQTIQRMNEGCLAWIYLGHGRKRELDYYRVPDGGVPIFSTGEIPRIAVRESSPIAVFLSCYAGAFESDPDCLAEKLLAQPRGPVAVIAGANVTMPYAMSILGDAMLHELFTERRQTIGEVLMFAKQTLAEPMDKASKSMIDQLAVMISPDAALLDDERAEHVRLFHLIGDPLLRIHHPKRVSVRIDEYGTSGGEVEVTGTSEVDGACLVELVCRRDRLTFKPPRRPQFEFSNDWLKQLDTTYAKANNTVWSFTRGQIREGKFSAVLPIPKDATGPSHVRVFVEGKREFAMGSSDIYLRAPQVDPVPATTPVFGETPGS